MSVKLKNSPQCAVQTHRVSKSVNLLTLKLGSRGGCLVKFTAGRFTHWERWQVPIVQGVGLDWRCVETDCEPLQYNYQQTTECECQEILKRIRATIVACKSDKNYVFWKCVSVALPYCIVICALSVSTIFFHIILKTARFPENSILNLKCVFWFTIQNLSGIFPVLTRIRQVIIINVHGSSCKVPVILAIF
jgi:hypothetical protein